MLLCAACSGEVRSNVTDGKSAYGSVTTYRNNKLCISQDHAAHGIIWCENLNFQYSKCNILKNEPYDAKSGPNSLK